MGQVSCCCAFTYSTYILKSLAQSKNVSGSFFPLPSISTFLDLPTLPTLPALPSFSLPSLPFSLPFSFKKRRKSSNPKKNKRDEFKQCAPAMPPVSSLLEVESGFERCRIEVAKNRHPDYVHPDQNKRPDEMITSYGYDLITYDNITTDDGYILTAFRITGGRKSPTKFGKPAVLLFHGLLSASDCWMLQPGSRNLAFMLADLGYDVWLANTRGTTYSQGHVVFSPLDDTYWDFGLHEIGMYDLPATIRLMLRETGSSKIFYVGHSMGCAIASIALSEIPELNNRIEAVIMLAPAVFIGHAYNPLRSFTTVIGTPLQDWIYRSLEGHFDGDTKLESIGLSPVEFCTPSAMRCGICDNLIFFLYGYDASQANYTNLPNIVSKIKNVVSLKTVIHFGQNLLSCQFRQYSYGFFGNFERYGWYHPPTYNLKAITAPIYIFHGENDNFIPPIDIEMFKDALSPEVIKGVFKVEWPAFNHVDFVVANDADVLVYNQIIRILKSFTHLK